MCPDVFNVTDSGNECVVPMYSAIADEIFTLFLLFARFFPVLALNELKSILKKNGEKYVKK